MLIQINTNQGTFIADPNTMTLYAQNGTKITSGYVRIMLFMFQAKIKIREIQVINADGSRTISYNFHKSKSRAMA